MSHTSRGASSDIKAQKNSNHSSPSEDATLKGSAELLLFSLNLRVAYDSVRGQWKRGEEMKCGYLDFPSACECRRGRGFPILMGTLPSVRDEN